MKNELDIFIPLSFLMKWMADLHLINVFVVLSLNSALIFSLIGGWRRLYNVDWHLLTSNNQKKATHNKRLCPV